MIEVISNVFIIEVFLILISTIIFSYKEGAFKVTVKNTDMEKLIKKYNKGKIQSETLKKILKIFLGILCITFIIFLSIFTMEYIDYTSDVMKDKQIAKILIILAGVPGICILGLMGYFIYDCNGIIKRILIKECNFKKTYNNAYEINLISGYSVFVTPILKNSFFKTNGIASRYSGIELGAKFIIKDVLKNMDENEVLRILNDYGIETYNFLCSNKSDIEFSFVRTYKIVEAFFALEEFCIINKTLINLSNELSKIA